MARLKNLTKYVPEMFRPHLPVLDDLKQKGPKKALQHLADDVVTRVTAGLSIADVRGVLRDDPAPRPNPRLNSACRGFLAAHEAHLLPQPGGRSVPDLPAGWLATFFFAWEIVTGIYLMIFYTPSPLVAYENMLAILSNVPFGRLMRDTHKLGGEFMIITVVLHMLRTFITGSYKRPRQFTWATGGLLLITTLFVSFFGYLLPWDQLSLWAVTIGASTAEATPLIRKANGPAGAGRSGDRGQRSAARLPAACDRASVGHGDHVLGCTITKSSSTATACRPGTSPSAKTPPARCRWTSAPTSCPRSSPGSWPTSLRWWPFWCWPPPSIGAIMPPWSPTPIRWSPRCTPPLPGTSCGSRG